MERSLGSGDDTNSIVLKQSFKGFGEAIDVGQTSIRVIHSRHFLSFVKGCSLAAESLFLTNF